VSITGGQTKDYARGLGNEYNEEFRASHFENRKENLLIEVLTLSTERAKGTP